MSDEKAHRSFQARIVLQFLHIEVKPRIVQLNGGWPVKESRIPDPGAELGRSHLRHCIDLLVAVPVLPVGKLRCEISEEGDRIRGLGTAPLIGGGDGFQ